MTDYGAYCISIKILDKLVEDCKKYGKDVALKKYDKRKLKLFYKIKKQYEKMQSNKNTYHLTIDSDVYESEKLLYVAR